VSPSDVALVAALVFVWGVLPARLERSDAPRRFCSPPFGAQVILTGHEYVACQAHAEGIGFTKEGDCFTGIADPRRLAQVADALSQHAAIWRLGQVCDR
jgi:hypothetical protein